MKENLISVRITSTNVARLLTVARVRERRSSDLLRECESRPATVGGWSFATSDPRSSTRSHGRTASAATSDSNHRTNHRYCHGATNYKRPGTNSFDRALSTACRGRCGIVVALEYGHRIFWNSWTANKCLKSCFDKYLCSSRKTVHRQSRPSFAMLKAACNYPYVHSYVPCSRESKTVERNKHDIYRKKIIYIS